MYDWHYSYLSLSIPNSSNFYDLVLQACNIISTSIQFKNLKCHELKILKRYYPAQKWKQTKTLSISTWKIELNDQVKSVLICVGLAKESKTNAIYWFRNFSNVTEELSLVAWLFIFCVFNFNLLGLGFIS